MASREVVVRTDKQLTPDEVARIVGVYATKADADKAAQEFSKTHPGTEYEVVFITETTKH